MQRLVAAGIAVVLLALGLTVVARRSPLRRREPAPLPGSAAAQAEAPDLGRLPFEQWTPRFIELERAGEWKSLAAQLDGLRDAQPDLYQASRLGSHVAHRRRLVPGSLEH